MKQKKPWLSIHFCDPRECFGERSFSEEEDAFISSMLVRPNPQEMQRRFVVPLLRSDLELFPQLAPVAQSLWFQRVQSRRSRVECAIKRGSVQLAADLYREAFDDVMNLCALSELEKNMTQVQQEASHGSARRTHVMYFGSAHVLVMSKLLHDMDFQTVHYKRQSPNDSCVSMRD